MCHSLDKCFWWPHVACCTCAHSHTFFGPLVLTLTSTFKLLLAGHKQLQLSSAYHTYLYKRHVHSLPLRISSLEPAKVIFLEHHRRRCIVTRDSSARLPAQISSPGPLRPPAHLFVLRTLTCSRRMFPHCLKIERHAPCWFQPSRLMSSFVGHGDKRR